MSVKRHEHLLGHMQGYDFGSGDNIQFGELRQDRGCDSTIETGSRSCRRSFPLRRPRHRSRARYGPWPIRQSPDCTTSAQLYPGFGSTSGSDIRSGPRREPPRFRRGRCRPRLRRNSLGRCPHARTVPGNPKNGLSPQQRQRLSRDAVPLNK